MLAAREIPAADAAMHAGKFSRDRFMGHELYEKDACYFGLGRIGGLLLPSAPTLRHARCGLRPVCQLLGASQLGVALFDSMD